MNSVRDHPKGGVAPFGNPRIKGCSPLPAAYRSVPRPSSPLSAKASTRCPYLTLDRETSRTGTSPAHDAPRRHSNDHDLSIEAVPRSHKNLFTMTINTGCRRTWDSRTRVFPTTSDRAPATAGRMQATGGGKRDRTDDLLLAKQALSQLSYAPVPGETPGGQSDVNR